jgi:hypothetical protein
MILTAQPRKIAFQRQTAINLQRQFLAFLTIFQ